MLQKDKVIILEPTESTNSIGERGITFTDKGKYFKGSVQPNMESLQIQMRGGVDTKSDKIYTTNTLPTNIESCHLLVNGEEYTIESINLWRGYFTKLVTSSEVK